MAKRFEYICETLLLAPDQLQALSMGILPKETMDSLNDMILGVMNEKGQDGWELLVPVSLPTLFFKKEVTTRAKKKGSE